MVAGPASSSVSGNFCWGIKGRVPTPNEGRRVATVQGLSTITNTRCRTLPTNTLGAAAQSIKKGLHPERAWSRSRDIGMGM